MAESVQNCSVCAACEDSPLSITGNVIGILTFALAIVAAGAVRISLVRRAAGELEWMKKKLHLKARIIAKRVSEVTRERLGAAEYEGRDVFQEAVIAARDLEFELSRASARDSPDLYLDHGQLYKILTFGVRYMLRRDQLNALDARSDETITLLNSFYSQNSRDGLDDNTESQLNTKLDEILQRLRALEK